MFSFIQSFSLRNLQSTPQKNPYFVIHAPPHATGECSPEWNDPVQDVLEIFQEYSSRICIHALSLSFSLNINLTIRCFFFLVIRRKIYILNVLCWSYLLILHNFCLIRRPHTVLDLFLTISTRYAWLFIAIILCLFSENIFCFTHFSL